MPRDLWAVHLCRCNDALALSPKEIGRLAGLSDEPTIESSLDRAGAAPFWKGAQLGAEFHLVSCCAPPEGFGPALREARIEEEKVVHLDLKGNGLWPAGAPEAANRLVARLIRSAIARAEAERACPSLTVSVSPSVLVYTDRPEGVRLADRLAERMEVHLVLDEKATAFDERTPPRRAGFFRRGQVSRIRGRLGEFHATIRSREAIDLDLCNRCGRCAPVCHTQAITQGLRLIAAKCDECGDCLKECAEIGAIRIPRNETLEVTVGQVVAFLSEAPPPESGRHTGYHVVAGGAGAEVDAVAFRVAELADEFSRPLYVGYDEKVCAGGTAEQEGCGICLTECPYDALVREGSRIRVEEATCEGCGGCVSACPTSALRFRDPSIEQIDAQLRALLSPLAGEEGGAGRPAVVFHCGEEGARALRAAGENRWLLEENLLPVEVPCLRFVSEALILRCFRLGAGGVALLGCADCPNGERPLVEARLEFCRSVLDAFGFGSERLAMIAVEASEETYYLASAVGDLGAFLERLEPAPLPPFAGAARPSGSEDGKPPSGSSNREFVEEALRIFVGMTGKRPGRGVGETQLPYAEVNVREAGCTLCAGCVFVCPTHALIMEEAGSAMTSSKRLRFHHLKCVACGLCEKACPESVVSLKRGLSISREALGYRDLVKDEMVQCISCGREYINKQALDAILGKLIGLEQIGDVFDGQRKNLLRMCPDCRGAHAVQEVERGWNP